MAQINMPAIDMSICSGWTENDVNLYNKLPFYLVKMQIERRKHWLIWSKFLGKRKWQPNMGQVMRAVTKEPSPHIRQFAFPNEISLAPKKDVMDIRERSTDEMVYRQRFESPILSFVPSFRDFLTDHVDAQGTDIMEKQERYEDIFYRGRIYHASPAVWIPNDAGGEMNLAPQGIGNSAGTSGKTTNWLQAQIPTIGNPGYLSMETLNRLLVAAETDRRIPPYSGSDLPKDDEGFTSKFLLVTSGEVFNHFSLDPWLLAYKNCNLDIVNGHFRGSLFGRITCMLEDMPLHFRSDATFPAPELRVVNPDQENVGESVPNPVYTDMTDANGSPYQVSFFVGTQGYEQIEVGPPPAAFASNGMPKGFGKMFWNGEVQITKNFLVPCYQDDGTLIYETNTYGEYLKFISQVTYGILGKQKRNIIPILHERIRGKNNAVV